jgi:hypothetical protein
MRSKPQYALAVAILLGAAGFVYGLTVAAAQNDGPPGPGWREVRPPKSLMQKWRDGDPRPRMPPPSPRGSPAKPYQVPR